MNWIFYVTLILANFSFWLGLRNERRKKNYTEGWAYTESWLCPNELCGFSVSANDSKSVEQIRVSHEKYCTKKRKKVG